MEHLHRDPAAQPDVVGHVDATARARADRREQAVAAGEHAAGEVGDATDRHPTQRTGRYDTERGTPERYPRRMVGAKRTRVFEHPGRVAVVMVVLLLTLTLGVTLVHNTDTTTGGSRPSLPSTIEAINPERGELTGLVDNVEVDLERPVHRGPRARRHRDPRGPARPDRATRA